MVKNININASYKNQNHLFQCHPQEFLVKVSEHFNIDVRNVELFSVKKGQRNRITPHDITDLMKIEIVDKSNSVMGGQRQLRSYFEEEPVQARLLNTCITKLTNNTPLTGQERKSLVELLQIFTTQNPKKRKIEEIRVLPKVCHKKVQVDPSAHYKDSFAQTDPFNTAPDVAHVQEEAISCKIRKLAANSDISKEDVAKLMSESFDERRNFILVKIPPVCAVKQKYPLLFSLDEVKNELGRIFYAEKCDEFIANIHRYAPLIIQKCNQSDELYLRTQKAIDRALTQKQKDYARAVGSIFILTKLMEEEWRFIHLQDYPHGSDDVYPHIDASYYSLKDLFFDNSLYQIVVEGQQLCEASNLLEAVLCLVASFFIFSINYPENCCRTMTVFEKLYLNANDTKDFDNLTSQMVKLLQLEVKSVK